MQILQDGTVQIRNKTTGATKIVNPSDLPNYGIPYTKYKAELDAYRASVLGENPKQAVIGVAEEVKKLPESIRKRTGTMEAGIVNTKLDAPLGLGRYFLTKKERDLADLESKYFSLSRSIMTTLEGKRPSDADAKAYQDKLGPSIKFPDYINQDRIKNLIGMISPKSEMTPKTDTLEDLYSRMGGQ